MDIIRVWELDVRRYDVPCYMDFVAYALGAVWCVNWVFGPKRDEVTGEWRKLHNEELRDLYPSPSIIRIIKSRRMRWAGHVARMGKKRNAYRLLVGKPEGKSH
jgi:hypothetical protein